MEAGRRPGSTMIGRLASSVLFALLVLPLPALADDVYLVSGGVFEGVIADVGPTQIRIRFATGSMTLPLARIARIERAESPLQTYLARERDLASRPDASAGEWMRLARWARARGVEPGFREAAVTAATLDPQLPGLAAVMRELDFVYDAARDRWLPYDQYMRAQGLVRHRGEWMSPEEQAARLRDEGQRIREAELTAPVETAVVASPPTIATPPAVVYAVPSIGLAPVAVFPGIVGVGGFVSRPAPRTSRPPAPGARGPNDAFYRRPPGSLIPATLFLGAERPAEVVRPKPNYRH